MKYDLSSSYTKLRRTSYVIFLLNILLFVVVIGKGFIDYLQPKRFDLKISQENINTMYPPQTEKIIQKKYSKVLDALVSTQDGTYSISEEKNYISILPKGLSAIDLVNTTYITKGNDQIQKERLDTITKLYKKVKVEEKGQVEGIDFSKISFLITDSISNSTAVINTLILTKKIDSDYIYSETIYPQGFDINKHASSLAKIINTISFKPTQKEDLVTEKTTTTDKVDYAALLGRLSRVNVKNKWCITINGEETCNTLEGLGYTTSTNNQILTQAEIITPDPYYFALKNRNLKIWSSMEPIILKTELKGLVQYPTDIYIASLLRFIALDSQKTLQLKSTGDLKIVKGNSEVDAQKIKSNSISIYKDFVLKLNHQFPTKSNGLALIKTVKIFPIIPTKERLNFPSTTLFFEANLYKLYNNLNKKGGYENNTLVISKRGVLDSYNTGNSIVELSDITENMTNDESSDLVYDYVRYINKGYPEEAIKTLDKLAQTNPANKEEIDRLRSIAMQTSKNYFPIKTIGIEDSLERLAPVYFSTEEVYILVLSIIAIVISFIFFIFYVIKERSFNNIPTFGNPDLTALPQSLTQSVPSSTPTNTPVV